MAKKLSVSESTWSRPVMHDILEAGGILKFSVRDNARNFISYWGYDNYAETICNEIKEREFNFAAVDTAIKALSGSTVFSPLHDGRDTKRVTPNQMANIIAAFCAENDIRWDDINIPRTSVEMDTYRKSLLGKACWDFGCFLSQTVSGGSSATSRTARVPGSTPKSGYKSSGPKSGLIKGLIGEPGEKIMSSDYFYVIVANSTKKKTQFVFTDPLSPVAEVNKVRIGDPSGWSSCKLLFETRPEAEEAIARIERGDIRVPSDITGFTIKKSKPDANGYFKIDTELGEALIKASKLNEAIRKTMDERLESASKKSSILDIDTYTEAFIDHV